MCLNGASESPIGEGDDDPISEERGTSDRDQPVQYLDAITYDFVSGHLPSKCSALGFMILTRQLYVRQHSGNDARYEQRQPRPTLVVHSGQATRDELLV